MPSGSASPTLPPSNSSAAPELTYCVGLPVDEGLVMRADTRTNAGVDHAAHSPLNRIVIGRDGPDQPNSKVVRP